MRLTDSTEVRSIAGGSHVAIFSFGAGKASTVATILAVSDSNVFPCSWLIEDFFEGERFVTECGAVAVGFDNGFTCEAGHAHRSDCEYFDDEEVAGAVKAGYGLPANARLMNGSMV